MWWKIARYFVPIKLAPFRVAPIKFSFRMNFTNSQP